MSTSLEPWPANAQKPTSLVMVRYCHPLVKETGFGIQLSPQFQLTSSILLMETMTSACSQKLLSTWKLLALAQRDSALVRGWMTWQNVVIVLATQMPKDVKLRFKKITLGLDATKMMPIETSDMVLKSMAMSQLPVEMHASNSNILLCKITVGVVVMMTSELQ